VTVEFELKLVPVTVMNVPPAIGPVGGFTAVTVGAAPVVYVYAIFAGCAVSFALVTQILTAVPAAVAVWLGIVSVNLVPIEPPVYEPLVTMPVVHVVVDDEQILALAAGLILVPTRLTTVPPCDGPVAGVAAVMVGAGPTMCIATCAK
jgi:hypothetical protein